jgi:LmbE family N-acetylglucosaminyl deacetylase
LSTAVFYSPHQDDEAIAMGGAIARSKRDGYRVILVLVTNGAPSARMVRRFEGEWCDWHLDRHRFSRADLLHSRMLEFQESAGLLGVDEIRSWGIDDSLAYNPSTYPSFREQVALHVRAVVAEFPNGRHNLVAGDYDVTPSGESSRSHHALWEVAKEISRSIQHVRFYRVYGYYHPASDRTATLVEELDGTTMAVKCSALQAYKRFDPGSGRLAFGYHSVRPLIDAACDDPREFVDNPRGVNGRGDRLWRG